MRRKIAKAIACDAARINIKATTNEGLGAIGRSEGIAALAIAMGTSVAGDGVRFFNTYSRKVENSTPSIPMAWREDVHVRSARLTLRAYRKLPCVSLEDLLQRHLELRGYNVQPRMNLTDVMTRRSAVSAGGRAARAVYGAIQKRSLQIRDAADQTRRRLPGGD